MIDRMQTEIKIVRWNNRYVLQLENQGIIYYAQRYKQRNRIERAIRGLLILAPDEPLTSGSGHSSSYWLGALSLYVLESD